MVVRLKDLMSAEERLDAALERLEEIQSSPDAWAAHESVTRDGRRDLHISDGQIRMMELRRAEVQAAEQHLRSLQRAFAAGVDAHSAPSFTLGGE